MKMKNNNNNKNGKRKKSATALEALRTVETEFPRGAAPSTDPKVEKEKKLFKAS
jgi:hypothetical protein